MNLLSSPKPVKVSLMMSSRIYAEKFCRQQNDPQKAKQVYLNSLAVSAVRIYLNSLGWSTALEQSDSWNPMMQTLMDIADLEIPGFGKIECRTVLLDQQELIVPPEVQSDRAAYIIVKFSSSLRECELLGFTPAITANPISLNKLQPIGNLTAHLRNFKQLQEKKKSQPMIELSKWWQGAIVFLVAMSGYLNDFRMIAKRLPDYHIRRDEGQFHFVGRVAGLQRAAQAGNLDTLPSGC